MAGGRHFVRRVRDERLDILMPWHWMLFGKARLWVDGPL